MGKMILRSETDAMPPRRVDFENHLAPSTLHEILRIGIRKLLVGPAALRPNGERSPFTRGPAQKSAQALGSISLRKAKSQIQRPPPEMHLRSAWPSDNSGTRTRRDCSEAPARISATVSAGLPHPALSPFARAAAIGTIAPTTKLCRFF